MSSNQDFQPVTESASSVTKFQQNPYGPNPVSYTHLDVYKRQGYICDKQRALAAFLFLVLVTWVVTFSISILRVVERVSSGAPRP